MNMCVFCRGTELKDTFTTYVAALDKFTIIIKNVPCQECVQCGERYFSDDVMQNIEAIVKKAIDVQSEFFVTEYSSVA